MGLLRAIRSSQLAVFSLLLRPAVRKSTTLADATYPFYSGHSAAADQSSTGRLSGSLSGTSRLPARLWDSCLPLRLRSGGGLRSIDVQSGVALSSAGDHLGFRRRADYPHDGRCVARIGLRKDREGGQSSGRPIVWICEDGTDRQTGVHDFRRPL